MEIRIKIDLAQKIFAYLYKTNPRLATEMFNGVNSLNPDTQMFRRENSETKHRGPYAHKCDRCGHARGAHVSNTGDCMFGFDSDLKPIPGEMHCLCTKFEKAS